MSGQKFEILITNPETGNRNIPQSISKDSNPKDNFLQQSIDDENFPITNHIKAGRKSIHSNQVSELVLKHLQKNKLNKSDIYIGPKYEFRNQPRGHQRDDSPKMEESYEALNSIDGFSNKAWRNKALEILMIILRFISLITKENFATSFRLVNRNVFQIIGDKASNFRYYLFNNHFKYEKPTPYQNLKYQLNQKIFVPLRRLKAYQYFLKNKMVLKPESISLVGWNVYILAIMNMNVLYVSTRVAFRFDKDQNQTDLLARIQNIVFDYLPSCSFFLEILLKFNTCYYHKGALIENRYMIAKNYIKSSFFFDIFVIIPFFLSLRFEVQYLDLVLILKVFQIQKFSGTLFDRLELTSNEIALFDLIKLCYTILAAAHFCACLWFLVGNSGPDGEISWIIAQKIQDEPWINQYCHSFYFSIVTMTTIGYGDVIPTNLRERVFTICMAVCAVGIFGYSLGNINSIYAEWSKKSIQFRTDMNNLKKYLRIKGINRSLAEKIRKYFEYVWTDYYEDNDKDLYKFQDEIPRQLQDEMKVDINMKIIEKIPFLKENFTEQFLVQLAKGLIEEKYAPDQQIYQQNKESDHFYILLRGGVSFYVTFENEEQTQQLLESIKGEAIPFGTLEFFQCQSYRMSCKSAAFSYVLKIQREEFIKLLKNNEKDYLKFCQIKEEVIHLNKQQLLQVTCRACNKTTHVIKECPMVSGYPNRAKVLLNYRRNIPSDRRKYHRNSIRRVDTLLENNDIKNSIYLFICNNKLITDQDERFNLTESQLVTEESNLEAPEVYFIPAQQTVASQINSCRPLSFQSCNDALQDSDIQERIKKIIGLISDLQHIDTRIKDEKLLQSIKQISDPFQLKLSNNESPPLLFDEYLEDKSMKKTNITPTIQLGDNLALKIAYDVGFKSSGKEVFDDDDSDKIRGIYKEIFFGFEKIKQYESYLPQNNFKDIYPKKTIPFKIHYGKLKRT